MFQDVHSPYSIYLHVTRVYSNLLSVIVLLHISWIFFIKTVFLRVTLNLKGKLWHSLSAYLHGGKDNTKCRRSILFLCIDFGIITSRVYITETLPCPLQVSKLELAQKTLGFISQKEKCACYVDILRL